ncbi:MAG: GNAT family N-acetyltransferase [Desulfitobacteriaceae bacterium]
MNLKIATLQQISLIDLTAIWNRCWQGYFYDMSYTPEQMQGWLNLGQITLAHSLALKFHDTIIGFSLFAIDGRDGWIAGTCIDPNYRRRGLFKPLLKAQIELGKHLKLERIYLEVLIQNHARKVYESVGFTKLRPVHIYRSGQEITAQARKSFNLQVYRTPQISFAEVEIASYFKARRQTSFSPTWQRRESYLGKYPNKVAFLSLDSNVGALFANKQCTSLLDTWSCTLDGAVALMAEIFQLNARPLSLTNQPEDRIYSLLSAWGIFPLATQLEMNIVF